MHVQLYKLFSKFIDFSKITEGILKKLNLHKIIFKYINIYVVMDIHIQLAIIHLFWMFFLNKYFLVLFIYFLLMIMSAILIPSI